MTTKPSEDPQRVVQQQQKQQQQTTATTTSIFTMAPPGSAHLNFTLGGFAMAAGAWGFAKKRSAPSLVAGMACGSLLVGSGVLISKNESLQGHGLAAGVTGIVTAAMVKRSFFTSTTQTFKFMPAGMIATIGAAGCAYNVKKTLEWWPDNSE